MVLDKVCNMEMGQRFWWDGREMIKVRPAYSERLALEVEQSTGEEDDFDIIYIDSMDNAAVDINSGELFFVTDLIELYG